MKISEMNADNYDDILRSLYPIYKIVKDCTMDEYIQENIMKTHLKTCGSNLYFHKDFENWIKTRK